MINSHAQTGVYKAGTGAGLSNTTGDFNTFLGDSAGFSNTSGMYNTFIGYHAGYSFSFPSFTYSDNTVIGSEAMGGKPYSVSSQDNVIIGTMAGYNHYGTDAVIIGTKAGYNNNNGSDVVFVGEEAGMNNTSGDDNVFIGEDAGYNNTTASDNTFVGSASGRMNTTGYRNTFVGGEAGYDNTTGSRNTFLGDSAGLDLSIGYHNTFVGQAAGACTEYAKANTFIGCRAGWDNNRTNETNNANYNTYLGYEAGFTNREGQYNVLLGAHADFSSSSMTGNGSTNSFNIGIGYNSRIYGELVYSGVIGASARVSANNSLVLGGLTSVNRMSVGIGTDKPNQNASLELAEDDKGFLISRMSETGKTTFGSALSTDDEGMMVYDSTAKTLNIWDGTDWFSSSKQSLSLTGNELSLSESNTIDLSPYLDNTDAQELALSDNSLSISNGTASIDLSSYLDNTDTQELALTGSSLSISNGNAVDLTAIQDGFEANTDTQELALTGNSLSISNGNAVDLTAIQDGFEANTDAQELTLTGSSLSISNGNAVDLTAIQDGFEANTDSQSLTGATLSGNTLEISIENGSSVSVDLSPLLETVNATLSSQEERITKLEADVAYLQTVSSEAPQAFVENDQVNLFQNIPNPSTNSTMIPFYIPESINKAAIVIYDNNGRVQDQIDLNTRGFNSIEFMADQLIPGTYYYSLLIDGRNAASRKMIIADSSY